MKCSFQNEDKKNATEEAKKLAGKFPTLENKNIDFYFPFSILNCTTNNFFFVRFFLFYTSESVQRLSKEWGKRKEKSQTEFGE